MVVQIPDAGRLAKVLKARLKDYNATLPKPLSLVFFADAVEHVCRIARLLRQPRGSALLVGASGSGKQTLTRFAAWLGGFRCSQPDIRRGYSPADFRQELKVYGSDSLFWLAESRFQFSSRNCVADWRLPVLPAGLV